MDSCTVIRCTICEKPYHVYAVTAENQSSCPLCKLAAEKREYQEAKKMLEQPEDLMEHGV